MSEFLDVFGASGASYRFRRAALDALPATGGNLVVVRPLKAGPAFSLCATAPSLMEARAAAAAAVNAARDAQIYVRLNVARATRAAEHADIVEAVKPATESVEEV